MLLSLPLFLSFAHAAITDPEILGNAVDDDLDGLTDVIRREYAQGTFEIIGSEWNTTPFLAHQGDRIGLTAGDSATLPGPIHWDAGQLHVGIHVSKPAILLPYCSVTVDLATAPPYTHPTTLALGYNDLAFSLFTPPYDIDSISITCTGGGTAWIQWVTLQNAGYEQAPHEDVSLYGDDAAFPGGGQNTVVVRGNQEVGCWAAADLGGVAWSTDCMRWTTANGDHDDLLSESTLGVWDVMPIDEDLAYIVTGRTEPGPSKFLGGFLYTEDRGETWEEIDLGDPESPDPVAVYRDTDDCRARDLVGTLGRGGGRLLESWEAAGSSWLFVANHVNDGTEHNRDVYIMERGTGMPVGASAGDVFEDAATGDPLSDLEAELPANGKYVGAMRLVDWEDGTAALFIGYKTGSASQATDPQSLFRCDFDESDLGAAVSAGTPIACEEIAAGQDLDVRDIEYIQDLDLLLVADGGRRFFPAWSTPGESCDHEEGEVWGLTVTGLTTSGMWELDDVTRPSTTEPSWNSAYPTITHPAGTGNLRPPQDADLPSGDFGYGSGELTGIAVTTTEIGQSTDDDLAIERYTHMVVAFFDAPESASDWYPRVFKAEILEAPEEGQPLDWTPLWDYHSGDVWSNWSTAANVFSESYNRGQRTNAILATNDKTWPYDQNSVDTWFPAWPIDGLLLADTEGTPDILVSSGYGIYRVYGSTSALAFTRKTGTSIGVQTCVGWEMAYEAEPTCGGLQQDIDAVPWSFAMQRPTSATDEDDSVDFGMTAASDVWFCAGCVPFTTPPGGYSDGRGYVTASDIGAGNIFGPHTSGIRRPADVDCHWDAWGTRGYAVDGVEVKHNLLGVAYSDEVLWMAQGPQSISASLGPISQSLFRRSANGKWCWLTTDDSVLTSPRSTYLTDVDLDGDEELACKWPVVPPATGYWDPCDRAGGGDGTSLSVHGYGVPWDVAMGFREPVQEPQNQEDPQTLPKPSPDIAVAAFRHDAGSGATGDNAGGLALLHTALVGAVESTKVDPIPAVDVLGDQRASAAGFDDCSFTEEQLFTDVPRLALDTTVSWYEHENSYYLRIYVGFWGTSGATSDDCKLWEVIDADNGTRTTTWTSIPLRGSAATCPLTYAHLQNISAAEWAPDTVFAYGGYDDGTTASSAVCALSTGIAGALPEIVMTDNVQVTDVAPHPDLSNVLLVGTKLKYSDENFTGKPGVYLAELSYDPSASAYEWGRSRILGKIGTVEDTPENPGIEALSWAAYGGGTREFYMATHGSGPLMGYLEW